MCLKVNRTNSDCMLTSTVHLTLSRPILSPLGVLILYIAEAGEGTAELFPHCCPVPYIQCLVYQNHRGQHLHGNQQLGM